MSERSGMGDTMSLILMDATQGFYMESQSLGREYWG